jgi:hypothetical protein
VTGCHLEPDEHVGGRVRLEKHCLSAIHIRSAPSLGTTRMAVVGSMPNVRRHAVMRGASSTTIYDYQQVYFEGLIQFIRDVAPGGA